MSYNGHKKRNVRNFWIDLDVDGRQAHIGTGPRTKDGGFKMVIRMRENGEISDKAIIINGIADGDYLSIHCDSPGCGSSVIRGLIRTRR